jgi:hypothetical protein
METASRLSVRARVCTGQGSSVAVCVGGTWVFQCDASAQWMIVDRRPQMKRFQSGLVCGFAGVEGVSRGEPAPVHASCGGCVGTWRVRVGRRGTPGGRLNCPRPVAAGAGRTVAATACSPPVTAVGSLSLQPRPVHAIVSVSAAWTQRSKRARITIARLAHSLGGCSYKGFPWLFGSC